MNMLLNLYLNLHIIFLCLTNLYISIVLSFSFFVYNIFMDFFLFLFQVPFALCDSQFLYYKKSDFSIEGRVFEFFDYIFNNTRFERHIDLNKYSFYKENSFVYYRDTLDKYNNDFNNDSFDFDFYVENIIDPKHLRFHQAYLKDIILSVNDEDKNLTFQKMYLKNPKNKYFINSDSFEILVDTETSKKSLMRFPLRNMRLSKMLYLLKNNVFNSEYFYSKDHGLVSYGLNKKAVYDSTKVLVFDHNSIFRRKKESSFEYQYINQLNSLKSHYLINRYKLNNEGLIYKFDKLQYQHLKGLGYNEIQFILQNLYENPTYKHHDFIDVHWDLYHRDAFDLLHRYEYFYNEQKTNYFFKFYRFTYDTLNKFDITQFIKQFYSIFFCWLEDHDFKFYLSILNNPFELDFNTSLLNDSSKNNLNCPKKYTFKEKELMYLPFHIYLKDVKDFLNDSFYTINLNQEARSSAFMNLFYNTNDVYRNKLSKYLNFIELSKKHVMAVVDGKTRPVKHASVQKFYRLGINPWWESLDDESKIKMLVITNMSEARSNMIMLNSLGLYFEGKSFYKLPELFFYSNHYDLLVVNKLKNSVFDSIYTKNSFFINEFWYKLNKMDSLHEIYPSLLNLVNEVFFFNIKVLDNLIFNMNFDRLFGFENTLEMANSFMNSLFLNIRKTEDIYIFNSDFLLNNHQEILTFLYDEDMVDLENKLNILVSNDISNRLKLKYYFELPKDNGSFSINNKEYTLDLGQEK